MLQNHRKTCLERVLRIFLKRRSPRSGRRRTSSAMALYQIHKKLGSLIVKTIYFPYKNHFFIINNILTFFVHVLEYRSWL